MSVKQSQLDVVLLCLTFYEFPAMPHLLYIAFKYSVVAYLFARYIKVAKKAKAILVPALLYGAVTIISSIINQMALNTIIASIVYSIQIVDIFLVSEDFILKRKIADYIKIIFYVFLIILLCTDLLMLVVNYNFSDPNEEYFIGNKFVVSYLHCFASALSFMLDSPQGKTVIIRNGNFKFRRLPEKFLPYLFTIYSTLICLQVTCSTGVICCICLIAMMVLPKRVKQLASNGKIMIMSIVVINFLLLGTYSILNNQYFENFVYNILGKSITWIGRLRIWENIFDLIWKKPFWGYGYYNSMVIQVVGFGNAQNAVLKFLLDGGIFGLFTYALLIWKSFKMSRYEEVNKSYPLIAFFYAMIVASAVEINLTHMIVFLAMAITYCAEKIKERRVL